MSKNQVEQVIALSDEEILARARQLAAAIVEVRITKKDRDDAAKIAKDKIAELEERIDRLTDEVHTGTEKRMVERQGGLFDGDSNDDGEQTSAEPPERGPSESQDPNAELVDASPAAVEPPAGALITDPSGLLGPEPETKGRKRRTPSQDGAAH